MTTSHTPKGGEFERTKGFCSADSEDGEVNVCVRACTSVFVFVREYGCVCTHHCVNTRQVYVCKIFVSIHCNDGYFLITIYV